MSFAGMNPLAIALAAVAALLFGAVYHRVFATARIGAKRVDPPAARPAAGLLATMLIADLLIAWVLAGTLGHLGPGQVTLRNGVISALFVWAGFMATTLAVNHRLHGLNWRLVLIDAGHWLGASLIMGAVIGRAGV